MTALTNDQPYPGLRPFEKGDEEFFFGRETQTRTLRKKLAGSHLVAVVGRSGCGKSSLVKAGLIPLLEKEKDTDGKPVWHIVSFRPQGQPIAELAKALWKLAKVRPFAADTQRKSAEEATVLQSEPSLLDPANIEQLRRSRLDAMLRSSSQGLAEAAAELALPERHQLLIIVDQFEEIFRFEGTQGGDIDEATAFARLLIEAINSQDVGIRVILTMRLDFLGDCARFQHLPEAISDGQFLVPNLSRAERRAAIEKPAKKCGATISPVVTQGLLNDIGENPDRLPVLQHVLMRTWRQAKMRYASEITLDDYIAVGGVEAAISRHADEVYGTLPDQEHRQIAERMFKAISELDRRGRSIRRPVPLGDIAAIAQTGITDPGDQEKKEKLEKTRRVVNAFRAPECCFLLPPADQELDNTTQIDISHESLLRGWVKLTGQQSGEGWLIEEDRDGKTYRGLIEDAEEFQKDPAAVLSRRQTADRTAWWKKKQPNAAWAERYGNRFGLVETLLARSVARQRKVRAITAAAVLAIVMVVGALAGLSVQSWYYRMEAEQARANQEERLLQVSRQAATEAAARRQEVELLQRETARLQAQLKGQGVQTDDDNVQQIAVLSTDAQQANLASALANQTGYMWIGSSTSNQLNLRDTINSRVHPGSVRDGNLYSVINNTFLRQGLPSNDGEYRQAPTIGILPAGSMIRAESQPKVYDRPNGQQQYWLYVRVVDALRLPTIFFQYTGGAGAGFIAQMLSERLQARGYKVPGEDRVDAGQGRREVRYFFREDKEAAETLAQEVRRIVANDITRFDLPVLPKSFFDFGDKRNIPGTVELWYDFGVGGGSKTGKTP